MSNEAVKATEADKAARGAKLRAILEGALSSPDNLQALDHALGEAGFELEDQSVVMARAVVEQVKAGALSQRDAKELLDKMLPAQQAQTAVVAGNTPEGNVVAAMNKGGATIAAQSPDGTATVAVSATPTSTGVAAATPDATVAAVGTTTPSEQAKAVNDILKKHGFKEAATSSARVQGA